MKRSFFGSKTAALVKISVLVGGMGAFGACHTHGSRPENDNPRETLADPTGVKDQKPDDAKPGDPKPGDAKPGDTKPAEFKLDESKRDDAGARAAFLDCYKVFMHPRCMNCHPAGDAPLQGDDSHIHAQNVQRGPDGMGLFALKCSACHQDANVPGEHMPPGNPNWHLPKKEMPLVFQGLSPRELAIQLKDPRRNGGKSLADLIHHVTDDSLVKAGWNPGDGRTLPPLSHDEFAKRFQEWVEKGAAEPE